MILNEVNKSGNVIPNKSTCHLNLIIMSSALIGEYTR